MLSLARAQSHSFTESPVLFTFKDTDSPGKYKDLTFKGVYVKINVLSLYCFLSALLVRDFAVNGNDLHCSFTPNERFINAVKFSSVACHSHDASIENCILHCIIIMTPVDI